MDKATVVDEYMKVVKICTMIIGIWPDQSKSSKLVMRTIIYVISVLSFVTQVRKIIYNQQSILIFLVHQYFVCYTNYYNICIVLYSNHLFIVLWLFIPCDWPVWIVRNWLALACAVPTNKISLKDHSVLEIKTMYFNKQIDYAVD